MKLTKYIKISAFAFGLTAAVGACTDDFEEMNTNPNNPVAVDAQYLLPNGIQEAVDNYWGNKTRNQRLNFDHAMSWVQYLTRNIYENEGDNYNVQPSVNSTNWEVFYSDALISFQDMEVMSGAEGDSPHTNYEGIAIGMQAWIFSLITDVWGAIPYSEALEGTNAESAIYSPTYDNQQDVYAGIIADLEEANTKLVVDGPSVSGDIMFSGDVMMWKKFFNSLRFKLLNRQAHIVTESATAMEAMLADPATYPMIESNDEIAQLNYGAVPTNNPWHDILVNQGRSDWNINSTLVNTLQELEDPRLEVYATPGNLAEGEYSGHPSGLPGEIATTYLGYSAIINVDVFAQTTSPAIIMSYAELLLTQAEAAVDGDISGDAQALYEAGIEAAFAQYGLEMPAGYLGLAGPATKENIMTQKWIALFGQGIEAWTELRRTGYPVLPANDPRAQFQNDGVLPTRLVYPSTEYSLNQSNVESGASMIGGDNMTTELWWVE